MWGAGAESMPNASAVVGEKPRGPREKWGGVTAIMWVVDELARFQQ